MSGPLRVAVPRASLRPSPSPPPHSPSSSPAPSPPPRPSTHPPTHARARAPKRPHARPPNRGFRVGRPHARHLVCGCGTIAYTHGTVHRAELSTGLCCSAAHSSDATPIPTRSPCCRHPRHPCTSHAPRTAPPFPGLPWAHATPLTCSCRRATSHQPGFAPPQLPPTRSKPAEEAQGARACHGSGPARLGAPRQPSCDEKATSY